MVDDQADGGGGGVLGWSAGAAAGYDGVWCAVRRPMCYVSASVCLAYWLSAS